MKNSKTYANRALLVIVSAALAIAALSGCGKESLPVIKDAPDFRLQNAAGGEETLQDSAGKVRLVEFMYTNCPDVCPETTYNMVQVQKNLKKKNNVFGEKVRFITISFDPEYDTPEVLNKYADMMGMDRSGWSVLRGEQQVLEPVLKDFGVMAVKQDDGTIIHNTTAVFLVDKKGKIRNIYKMGKDMDTEVIYNDIMSLVKS